MEMNVGDTERVLRFFLGFILAATGLFLIFEALAGWCATYELLGINTR